MNAGPDADMGWLIEQFAVRDKVPLQIDMNGAGLTAPRDPVAALGSRYPCLA